MSESASGRGDISEMRFRLGDKTPSSTSVHGKIRAVVGRQPGISGDQLLQLLRRVDFSDNKTDLPDKGRGSDKWLIGYIRGGLRRRFIEIC
jgi:hypothetical protein